MIFDAKYYYSQDGVKWLDLVAIDGATHEKADKFKGMLSGDAGKVRRCAHHVHVLGKGRLCPCFDGAYN